MIKGCKTRLFPTKDQEEKLWEHIHAARFVWNWGLDYEMELFRNGEKHLSAYSLRKVLTRAKKTEKLAWLNTVSSHTLSIALLDLGAAYDRFFANKPAKFSKRKIEKAARTGKNLSPYALEKHPKFKSKKDNKFKFPVRHDSVYFTDGCVNIEKIGKVKYRGDRDLPQGRNACKVANPRIKFENNKWILSFGMERDNQAPILTDKSLGIDLGISELAVASFGGEKIVCHNINKSKRVRTLEHKKKHVQRVISRKYRTNGNYAKTKGVVKYEAILRKIDSKLSNIRKNYTHQTTHRFTSLLPCRVVMEDLNVQGMMKNWHLAKAIQQQCWSEFIRQMKYKCEWSGIEFVQVGRFYPSSKTCSCCGEIKTDLKLKDRVFRCDCGLVIDRDFNAAINLERYDSPKVKEQSA